MSNRAPTAPRPPTLRRSWLFVPGADRGQLRAATDASADVLIQELEDFVPRSQRAQARALIAGTVSAWRQAGAVIAIRINPLADEGALDLEAAMAAKPDIIALPKVSAPAHIIDLDAAVGALERRHGYPEGTTELLPNIESAAGARLTFDIARSSPRVTACLVAAEDMAADLGAVRARDGAELAHIRARFHVDCVAAGVVSVDCPYTWADADGAAADAAWARRLGYTAKSAVVPSHAEIINRVMTPSPDQAAQAARVVEAFEAARATGRDRVEVDGNLVEVPTYLNAKRLLDRAAAFGVAPRSG